MDVVILEDSETVADEAAALIREVLAEKPGAVLGLATGRTPLATYAALVADCAAGRASFRDACTFNLDEYIGLTPDNPHSYRAYMQRELFDHIDIDPANTFLPECPAGADPRVVGDEYEALIREHGGIDLQLLGIGKNGHIGFNEPASSLASRTRIKTLTRATVEANRSLFDDPATQPQLAMTMGIGSIMDARHVVMLATGADKTEPVRQMIEGPVSAMWPATMLQMHEKVTVLLDADAAASLELRDYYDWIAVQKRNVAGTT